MKKTLGILVCILGGLMLAFAAVRATLIHPNISYLVGTFLPGVGALIAGLWLLQKKDGPDK